MRKEGEEGREGREGGRKGEREGAGDGGRRGRRREDYVGVRELEGRKLGGGRRYRRE